MSQFDFTNTWFESQKPVHEEFLTPLAQRPINLLEIGSHEGRSTVYFLQKLIHPQSTITCIDPFIAEDPTSPVDNLTFVRFQNNVNLTGKQVLLMKEFSSLGLARLTLAEKQFDYILIDGSHLNKDVMLDACMSFNLLKSGGIIFFDDYNWGNPTSALGPALGIKSWLAGYEAYFTVLHTGYHLVIRKH